MSERRKPQARRASNFGVCGSHIFVQQSISTTVFQRCSHCHWSESESLSIPLCLIK